MTTLGVIAICCWLAATALVVFRAGVANSIAGWFQEARGPLARLYDLQRRLAFAKNFEVLAYEQIWALVAGLAIVGTGLVVILALAASCWH